jgi:hypothetical protein
MSLISTVCEGKEPMSRDEFGGHDTYLFGVRYGVPGTVKGPKRDSKPLHEEGGRWIERRR